MPFLDNASANGFDIIDPMNLNGYVFANAVNSGNKYPICYMVENQHVYCVSVIEKNSGDLISDNYMKCIIAMARSINPSVSVEDATDASKLALANPDVGVVTITNDMHFIYHKDEGMITISY